jgi:hypothetical protein
MDSQRSIDPFDDVFTFTMNSDYDIHEDDIVAVIRSLRERLSGIGKTVSGDTDQMSLKTKSFSSVCSTSFLEYCSSSSTKWTDEESFKSSMQPNWDQESCTESYKKGKLQTGCEDFCHCQFGCFHPVHFNSFEESYGSVQSFSLSATSCSMIDSSTCGKEDSET